MTTTEEALRAALRTLVATVTQLEWCPIEYRIAMDLANASKAARAALAGAPLVGELQMVSDPTTVPPGEVKFMQDGKEVGRIIGLDTSSDSPSSSETPAEMGEWEPFVVKYYSGDSRPTIKGNGFDGMELGENREEAEDFVRWINARLAAPSGEALPLAWICTHLATNKVHHYGKADGWELEIVSSRPVVETTSPASPGNTSDSGGNGAPEQEALDAARYRFWRMNPDMEVPRPACMTDLYIDKAIAMSAAKNGGGK